MSSTNGFHSFHFFPCQRPPQTVSATVAGGYAMCKPYRCVWKFLRSKVDAAPPPFPPMTPHTTIIFRTSAQPTSCCVLIQKEQLIPVGMFTVSRGCRGWNGLTIYFQHPFIRVNWKGLTWLPVEPLMMGIGLDVPYLPNGCLQACPCSCAPCAHASFCHCLRAYHPSHPSPLTHISACFPCCRVFLGALVCYSKKSCVLPFTIIIIITRKKFCRYKEISKSW